MMTKNFSITKFFILIIAIVGITTIWLSINSSENYLYLFRKASFNITSILTGTGYTSYNYSTWGSFGLVIMLIIMFIGGCAGSTACGLKIFRIHILYKFFVMQLKKYIFQGHHAYY